MKTKKSAVKIGRLIILEGVDGAGKTTLAQNLVNRLNSQGHHSTYFSFPGREAGTFGAEVYRLHHQKPGPESVPIHSASMQLLHIAAHIDAIEGRILPMLRDGTNVVLDRFWWSTWVYGIVSGASASSLKAMIEVENCHWGKIRPAMVFLILRDEGRPDDTPAERIKRIEEYHLLSLNEKNEYPVRTITNNDTLEAGLTKLIKELNPLDWTEPKPATPKTISHQTQLLLKGHLASIRGPQIINRLAPAKNTLVFDSYWRFSHERQRVFFARINHKRWPWTEDPVLREYKFTNAYRASDRVSQYLIREVIYRGDLTPNEIFFRTLLFKVFNRIETWELLRREVGDIAYTEYSFQRYNAVLSAAMARGDRIYSAAYIMPSGGSKSLGGRKHSMHLKMIDQMIRDRLPEKIAASPSMAKAFELIRAYPTIGDFLAYQYITDLNYSPLTSFSETEFVMPGPGALSGIHKCFSDLGGLTETDIIKFTTDRQDEEFSRLGLSFQNLWGRSLQFIDCQNLFCEVDKYARVKHPQFSAISGRTRIKQRFVAEPSPISYWYPPKWGINAAIEKNDHHV